MHVFTTITFRLTILLTAVFFVVGILLAQTTELAFSKIEQAIAKSDVQALTDVFADHIELNIAGKDEVYTKNQAQFVLKEFFMNYPVRSFKILSKGSGGGMHYAVGEYISGRGRFDANIFLKKTENGFFIEQLRFEQSRKQ